jgi:hypothetical protein
MNYGVLNNTISSDIKYTPKGFNLHKTQLGIGNVIFCSDNIINNELSVINTRFINTFNSIITNFSESLSDFSDISFSIPQHFIFGIYLNDLSVNLYKCQLRNTDGNDMPIYKTSLVSHLRIPVTSKNSVILYDDCNIHINKNTKLDINNNILTNSLTIIKMLNNINSLIVYSGGVNSFTEKPNKLILFTYSINKFQTFNVSIFTCLYYSYLLNNIMSTESQALNYISEKIGFSVNNYNYFLNDHCYNYMMYNDINKDINMKNTDIKKCINYPLQCLKITAQIYFLWNIVCHYATINDNPIDTSDINFSITFFKCIYENMNELNIITTSQINNTFPNLLPSELDTTIHYWVEKINKSVNITNIFILQHALELLNNDMSLLLQNNVNVLKDNDINYEIYNKRLNAIFGNISKVHKLNTLVNHKYNEQPLGNSHISYELF